MEYFFFFRGGLGKRRRERCERGIYSRNIAKIPFYVNDQSLKNTGLITPILLKA